MPLSVDKLHELQSEALADDVPLDLAVMQHWTEAEARSFFESGGTSCPPPRLFAQGRARGTNLQDFVGCKKRMRLALHCIPQFMFTYICHLGKTHNRGTWRRFYSTIVPVVRYYVCLSCQRVKRECRLY